MSVTFRAADRSRDRAAVARSDTSFETASVFDVVVTPRAVELREQGLTLHQVCATLDGEGYKARNGAALSVSTIHRITKRAAVAA
jgi:hypothetical protein